MGGNHPKTNLAPETLSLEDEFSSGGNLNPGKCELWIVGGVSTSHNNLLRRDVGDVC